jgi:UDP-glucose 4-epimerase
MLFTIQNSQNAVNIFNLGSSDKITVVRIGELIVEEMGLTNVQFNFTGGTRGWTGDIPIMILDINKIHELGFEFKINSESAVREAIKCVLAMKSI